MIIRNSLARPGSRYPVIATSYRSILGLSQSFPKRNDVSSSSIHTLIDITRYSRPPPSTPLRRTFHSTSKRHDVFFFALPALKGALLNVTRVSLITLPFIWRWRLWQKYRRTSMILVNIPIIAFCLVLALGLDQSPRTDRWRLLLMSENEEMAWSMKKFDEVLTHDGPLLLPSTSPLTQRVSRVCTRLVQALEEEDQTVIHGASWPPKDRVSELSKVIAERERRNSGGVGGGGGSDGRGGTRYEPSAKASSAVMPFRPESANPLKVLEGGDWSLYVVDLPKINAFALPSKDIFVYAGLVDLVDDDTLLAAVLAHEIAHVTQRHAVENLGFLNIAAVAFDVLRGISFALTISFPFITDSAGLFINWLNNVVAERAYSRKLEMEADAVGLNFMAEAGYDPRAALDLWDLMAAVEADAASRGQPLSLSDRLSLLQTHPTSNVRQDALARLMPKALELYKQSDVYKQTIARRLQKKQEADKARTTEVAEKKQDKENMAIRAREVVDTEVAMQQVEREQKQDGIERADGGKLPSASKPVTEQVRLV
ncbi:peptidase family M48-domain-containing protein [Filobasidium floriforme]|uniref:peptidase family M48-domain-containing protein n=1 Tax=Filobasidium floriforme TaxID=5210 RepID=UPI001E8CFB41|nr:peptidase family M48-domain-containing protein [Filobasidium floriforme]KAH8085901.1 peptidase family M48-domain-containing protein [Filobasidium floriforme]